MVNTTLIAANACLKAGEAIMKVYNTGFDVEFKPDQTPITDADRRANTIIQAYLEKTGIPIISEENDKVAYELRKDWGQLWMVDPLDGTREFVKRNGEFTVNIALIKQGKPIFGVIYAPVTGHLYIGDVQKKETRRLVIKDHKTVGSKDIEAGSILKSPKKAFNHITVLTSRSHLNETTMDYLESLRTKNKSIEITKAGSSLKFCLMAEGKADLYPRFGPSMEWDTAAGQAICEALNISVLSVDDATALTYNKQNLFNPNFIVS